MTPWLLVIGFAALWLWARSKNQSLRDARGAMRQTADRLAFEVSRLKQLLEERDSRIRALELGAGQGREARP